MAQDRRVMLHRTFAATSLAATLFFAATNAHAITIINPSFEADADYEVSVTNPPAAGSNPTGWEFYRPDAANSGQYFGVETVVGDYYNQATAPNGARIAYFDLGGDGGNCYKPNDPDNQCAPGDGDYPLGLQQTLGDTLQANSLYKLEVEIGNPKTGPDYNYEGFGGYRTELLAGNTVIGFDNNTLSIGEGEFATSMFVVSSNDLDVSLLDLALGIRLIHKGAIDTPSLPPNSEPWYSSVSFDDVRLSVSPVPVPAAVWLFGTALLGLIGFGKRRKAA